MRVLRRHCGGGGLTVVCEGAADEGATEDELRRVTVPRLCD